jgi:hypothetical protein
MDNQPSIPGASPEQPDVAITGITVAGFKSIRDEQSIEVRPLTILAGANSSGKSSMMQPLLLLKQTLESAHDPGALLLNGPHVRFAEPDQLLSLGRKDALANQFHVQLRFGEEGSTASKFEIGTYFKREGGSALDVWQTAGRSHGEPFCYKKGMQDREIRQQPLLEMGAVEKGLPEALKRDVIYEIARERCFLYPNMKFAGKQQLMPVPGLSLLRFLAVGQLRAVIHLPGLRANRERTYPPAAVEGVFPGPFQDYTGSVIAQWQEQKNQSHLPDLNRDMQELGLTWGVKAKGDKGMPIVVEVGRLSRKGSASDFVSIADVGSGISQCLPVLVALHAAQPDQLVYVEEPEIQLHPRAQVALARVLARAVGRRARIVVETHSSLLILALQALVARGDLAPDLVKLHWFARSETDGVTTIHSADLDDAGAFGDWPEDFGEVEAQIENQYLSAAEARLFSR